MPLRKPSDDYNRVGGSRRFARDFNKLNREVARQSDVSLPVGGTNGVDGVTQGAEPARLLVKITAKDGSTPPKYSWTAQLEANATLGDDTVGFAGTDTNFWAYELNGNDVPIGTIVELRPGHGGEYFWFAYTGGGSVSLSGTTPQITFWAGASTLGSTADMEWNTSTKTLEFPVSADDFGVANDAWQVATVSDGSCGASQNGDLWFSRRFYMGTNDGLQGGINEDYGYIEPSTDGLLIASKTSPSSLCYWTAFHLGYEDIDGDTVPNYRLLLTAESNGGNVDYGDVSSTHRDPYYAIRDSSSNIHNGLWSSFVTAGGDTITIKGGIVTAASAGSGGGGGSDTITITDGTTSQDVVSGDTITFTSGTGVDLTVSATDTVTADLDIAGLSTITFNSAEDYVPVLDGTDSSIKRALLPSYSFTLTGDSGSQTISGSDTMTIAGSNGILTTVAATDTCTVSINIPGLTEETTIEAGDYFLLYDASVAANRKYPASSIPTPSTGGPANASYLSEYTDWSIAATTNTVTLATFSAKTHVDKVLIRRKTAQSGVTEVTFTLTLESTGEASSSYSPIDPLDASDSAHNVALTDYCGSYTNTTALKLTVNSSGGNLSSLTAGAIEVWAFYRTLPVPT